MRPYLKLALDSESTEPESHTGRNVAMGAAAAAPFAGMIGQKPIIHDPLRGAKGKKFRSLSELGRQAQVGDILITSKPEGSLFKRFISPATGSEFYHAQPVLGHRGGQALTSDTGHLASKKRTVKHMLRNAARVADLGDHGYPDVILLRPKKPLTAAQQAKFQRMALERSHYMAGYDPKKAAKIYLQDIFAPKIPGITGTGPQQSAPIKDWYQKIDKNLNVTGKPTLEVVCSGNVCSTVPAMAMEHATGRGVVPGKAAQDVFPTDFLRSEEYELVGSRVKSKYPHTTLMRAAPYLMRAGLGAAGAGAVYAGTEKPEVAGAAGGALGASLLASKINRHFSPSMTAAEARIPTTGMILLPGIIDTPFTRQQVIKRWAARRLPILAAGGAAGYYGTRALRNYLAERRHEHHS